MRKMMLLALVAFFWGNSVVAQEEKETNIQTLLIQDGQVFLNGRPIAIPKMEGEPLELISHSYFQATIMGEQPLIFPIGDHWFRFEENELIPHNQLDLISTEEMEEPAPGAVPARRMEADRSDAYDLYFRDLQRQNQVLSVRFTREQRMEAQAHSLAARILSLQSENQKVELREQLRETLGDILDIKQQNRLAEIDELETRLENLKLSLQKREEMRDQLIDARMRELIGEH
jgi:hypothetical protein